MSKLSFNKDFKYQRVYGKISGYTTCYNAVKMNYPFVPAIKSVLGFVDELVVTDGCSIDGSWEILQKLAEEDSRIQLYQNSWDLGNPTQDGDQKAFSRALCSNDYLFQFDLDEIVHEDDYEKIKMITKRFPTQAPILHLPVVELWGNTQYATRRHHAWKWRVSKNIPEITHGVNKYARLTHPETGKIYAKEGMSDSCEYVHIMTYDPIGHVGFYNDQIEMVRRASCDQYGSIMNQIFSQLPSVWHTSWMSLENKIRQFRTNWDHQWNVLYQRPPVERFPNVNTDSEIVSLSQKLYEQGGEDKDQFKGKFKLNKNPPKLLTEWIEKNNIKLSH